MKSSGSRILWLVASFAVAAVFVALWQAAVVFEFISPVFLPSPLSAARALRAGWQEGFVQERWGATVLRMLVGWVCGSAVGILLGALVGISRVAREYLSFTFEVMRPMPAAAFIPVGISLLGLSETMVLSVIAFGAAWPVLLATVYGFSSVEPRLRDVCRTAGLSELQFIAKVSIPNSVPDIISGMRLGLTVSLIVAVVGEMLATRVGLGEWILMASRSFRSADLYGGIILLAITGLVTTLFLSWIERRLVSWRDATV